MEKYFEKGKPVFCPYLLVGYPTEEIFFQMIDKMIDNGAKILELGIPFSDPTADGPTLTYANDIVTKQGIGINKAVEMIAKVKQKYPDTGIVIMSYFNSILHYGIKDFSDYMTKNNIDGFLIPDVPYEEYKNLHELQNNTNVMIISDNLSDEDIINISNTAKGFLYVLTGIGITGTRKIKQDNLKGFIDRLRQLLDSEKKLVIGFGISSQDLDFINTLDVDGYIIGSEIVKVYTEKSLVGLDNFIKN